MGFSGSKILSRTWYQPQSYCRRLPKRRKKALTGLSEKIHTSEKTTIYKGKLTNWPDKHHRNDSNESNVTNPHLFSYLAGEAEKLGLDGLYLERFTKVLLDESGNLVAVFAYKVDPLREEIVKYLK